MKNYFTSKELACNCCGLMNINPDFLDLLNMTRGFYGDKMIINSGCRCEKHNTHVGSTSMNHVLGRAVDVKCDSSIERWKIVCASMKAGMPGIGIKRDFIHLDTNRDFAALWVY